MSEEFQPNKQWIYDRLDEVSRTFSLSLQFLPEPLELHVSTAYLLCRIPDTIEDSSKLSTSQQTNLLDDFSHVMAGNKNISKFIEQCESVIDSENISINDDWNLVLQSDKVLNTFQSFSDEIQEEIRPWVVEMTEGMNLFISKYKSEGGLRIQTEAELEEYCYYVAGTVGHLLTDVISTTYDVDAPQYIHESAEKFGLLLQFVNIAKDVYDDFETENNIYLPTNQLTKQDVSFENITAEENSTEVEVVTQSIINSASKYSSDAETFLKWARKLNTETFQAFAIPYLLAVGTIRELRQSDIHANEVQEVKMSREEVMQITHQITQDNPPQIEQLAKQIQQNEIL